MEDVFKTNHWQIKTSQKFLWNEKYSKLFISKAFKFFLFAWKKKVPYFTLMWSYIETLFSPGTKLTKQFQLGPG